VINRRDLDFLLKEWLKLGELLERPRFASHEIADVEAVLTACQDLAEAEIAPHLRASDDFEPNLDASGQVKVLPAVADGVRRIAELGVFSSVLDHELGGLQLPNTVYMAMMGLLMSGSIATSSFMLLTVGNARLIAAFGSPSRSTPLRAPKSLAPTWVRCACRSRMRARRSATSARSPILTGRTLMGSDIGCSATDVDIRR